MTTDPTVAAAPPTDTIPAPLTLQQRAEMAAEASRLIRALRDDNTWHNKCATFADGHYEVSINTAFDAVWLVAYRTELDHKMDIAAQLAQVEARA